MYDTALPSTPSLPAAFGIIEKNLIDSTSKEQTLQNKLEWAELCLDYRMNPYFSTWLANSMKHEASSSPWKWNDKRTVPFLSDKRFNRFAVPYHSLSHNELDSLLQRLKQTDLLDKSYFYLWDEPAYMKEYHLIGQYSQEIHKLMPEAKVLTTFYCGPKDGKYKDRLFSVFDLWRGDTQIFSMSAWALQANEANADTCRSLLRRMVDLCLHGPRRRAAQSIAHDGRIPASSCIMAQLERAYHRIPILGSQCLCRIRHIGFSQRPPRGRRCADLPRPIFQQHKPRSINTNGTLERQYGRL